MEGRLVTDLVDVMAALVHYLEPYARGTEPPSMIDLTTPELHGTVSPFMDDEVRPSTLQLLERLVSEAPARALLDDSRGAQTWLQYVERLLPS